MTLWLSTHPSAEFMRSHLFFRGWALNIGGKRAAPEAAFDHLNVRKVSLWRYQK